MIPAPLLRVENLVKHFPSRHGTVKAINDVSFEVARGEALGLVGESGSGKTTVGRCLLGLIRAGSGRVVFEGRDLATVSAREMRRLRARIQFVFQDPTDALNPRMRIGDLLADPMRRAGRMDSSSSMKRAAELLDLVGLGAGCATRYPHEFSTGEQQRIGIARAIATKPDLVVLDEPTSALDVSVRAEILNLLQELQTELGITYLFISHDLTAVRRVCQRIAIMYLGRIVEIGPADAIYANPRHPYTQALLRAIPEPDPERAVPRDLPRGEVPDAAVPPLGCSFHPRCPLAFEPCGWESRDLRELLEARWARNAGAAGVEEEQAIVGDLDVLDRSTSAVRLPAPRGRQAEDVVALLKRIQAEDPGEPFWRGIERLEAAGTRTEVEFHAPQEPRLEPVGEVEVACHLYDAAAPEA